MDALYSSKKCDFLRKIGVGSNQICINQMETKISKNQIGRLSIKFHIKLKNQLNN